MIVALDGKCSVADGGDERKDAVFFPYVGAERRFRTEARSLIA
jgi:hypothetical protein